MREVRLSKVSASEVHGRSVAGWKCGDQRPPQASLAGLWGVRLGQM
jgi:hypothetical protein